MKEETHTAQNEGGNAPYIDRGEPLPQSYAENRIVAMVRDPEHLFAYWDVDTAVRVAASPVVLRVHCLSEKRSHDIVSGLAAESWYLDVIPNRTYQLELFERLDNGELHLLASSEEVTTPVRHAGESGAERPAEITHARRHPLTQQKKHRAARAPHAVMPTGAPVAVPRTGGEFALTGGRSGGL